jgi:hypothetical protein
MIFINRINHFIKSLIQALGALAYILAINYFLIAMYLPLKPRNLEPLKPLFN